MTTGCCLTVVRRVERRDGRWQHLAGAPGGLELREEHRDSEREDILRHERQLH